MWPWSVDHSLVDSPTAMCILKSLIRLGGLSSWKRDKTGGGTSEREFDWGGVVGRYDRCIGYNFQKTDTII